MLSNKEIGEIAERASREFLESNGYRILEMNYRFKRAEVDIIACLDKIIVFVEVKARSSFYFGRPEEFVRARKQRMLLDAANHYIIENDHEGEIRFDIISVDMRKSIDNPNVEHLEDAFFPHW